LLLLLLLNPGSRQEKVWHHVSFGDKTR